MNKLIVKSNFHIYILTQLNYSISIFWLDLISTSSQSSIRVLDLTRQAIENDIKCQDLLFLNLLRHYIWKTFVQQTNLFLFLLFALSCCIFFFFFFFLILTRFNTHYGPMRDSIYCSGRCASVAPFPYLLPLFLRPIL